MANKKYSERLKNSAIKSVLKEGVTISNAARDFGISYQTLQRWILMRKLKIMKNEITKYKKISLR